MQVKEEKWQKAQLKLSAQQEAHERAAKAKLQRLSINVTAVKPQIKEDTIQPPTLLVGVESSNNNWHALLDSGAEVNVMSMDIYNQLRNKQQAN